MAYRQLEGSVLSVDAHEVYDGPKVKYMSKEKFRDMATCLRDLEHDKNLHKFGIVGVIPPDKACPPLFDLLNKGAEGLKHLRHVPGITEHAQQRLYRFAKYLVYVENDFVVGSMTFEMFLEKAKLHGIFELISRDVEEAIRIWWDRHADVIAKLGVDPKPFGTLYPYTIDGSVYKTVPNHDCWDLSNPVGDIIGPTLYEQDPEGKSAIIRGSTTSATFLGTTGTCFAGHWEDMHLLSVNWHWGGAPKVWYSVPLMYIAKFRKFLLAYLKLNGDKDVDKCEDVLRHKKYILHPDWFRMHGIPLVRLIQYPGEYVVTFPQGYHFGINLGINMNEAINVGTVSWINWGKVCSSRCTCRPDGVVDGFRLNMVPFVAKYQKEKLAKWLEGKDDKFPATEDDGAVPKVPPAPTLEDLLDMEVNVPMEVKRRIKFLDKDHKLRDAMEKKEKELDRLAAEENRDFEAVRGDFEEEVRVKKIFQTDDEIRRNLARRSADEKALADKQILWRKQVLEDVITLSDAEEEKEEEEDGTSSEGTAAGRREHGGSAEAPATDSAVTDAVTGDSTEKDMNYDASSPAIEPHDLGVSEKAKESASEEASEGDVSDKAKESAIEEASDGGVSDKAQESASEEPLDGGVSDKAEESAIEQPRDGSVSEKDSVVPAQAPTATAVSREVEQSVSDDASSASAGKKHGDIPPTCPDNDKAYSPAVARLLASGKATIKPKMRHFAAMSTMGRRTPPPDPVSDAGSHGHNPACVFENVSDDETDDDSEIPLVISENE